MEGQNIFRAIRFPLSHLPTFFLVIGYPIFWLELYVFKVGHGQTTPGAWTIFSIFAFIAIFQNHSQITAGLRNFQTWFKEESSSVKALLVAAGIAAGVIFLSALYASFLPPHLVQEFDAINYHITLPRQHLLLGSFGHIPWSSADLYFLPIDFALAPFWLATSLPNKLPQFFFVIGLLAVSGRLAWRFSGGKTWPVMLVVLAILGSHNIGIQAGTAMLDIAICYLFLAALDSFLSGAIWLGIIEISFYFWSKPLIPAQVIVTVALFGLAWLILRACGIRKNIWVIAGEKTEERMGDARLTLEKGIGFFLIISSLIAGPFIFKSLRYSGTPIFPLGVGTFRTVSISQSPERWSEINAKARQLLASKDAYGSGRNLREFIKHFWLIAVPEKGVNNRYDYPLGLMYLLFVGPFLFSFFSSLRQKVLPLLFLWVIVSWAVWWFGCQQTRFLYVPLVLMYLAVALSIRMPSRILLGAMLISILLVSASVYRANRYDFGRWGEAVLREKDKELIQIGKNRQSDEKIVLPFYDAAYASFPVEVGKIEGNDSLFVFKTVFKPDK